MQQPLQPLPIQKPQRIFKYRPFVVSFVLCFIFLIAWIILFVQTSKYCWGNCLGYFNFIFSCEKDGALYCCSYYETYGLYRCGSYQSCYLDNTVCETYRTWSIITGSLLFVSWIFMIITSCTYRRRKDRIQLNNMNGIYNGNNIYNQQNQYANQNQYYPVYQNANGNPYSQQVPVYNNPYNQPQLYVPPSSNRINPS